MDTQKFQQLIADMKERKRGLHSQLEEAKTWLVSNPDGADVDSATLQEFFLTSIDYLSNVRKSTSTPKVDYKAKIATALNGEDLVEDGLPDFCIAVANAELPERGKVHIILNNKGEVESWDVKGTGSGGGGGERQSDKPIEQRAPFTKGAYPGTKPLYKNDVNVDGESVGTVVDRIKDTGEYRDDGHLQRFMYGDEDKGKDYGMQYGMSYRRLQDLGVVPAIQGDDRELS